MRTISYFVAVVTIASSLTAGSNAPSRYNAITDTAPRPEPALPALGPAGATITDPAFGSRILRVTDSNTQPDVPGAGFLTPGGSFENNWNADSSMFWAWGKGGIVVFRFDAGSFRATPLSDPGNAARPLVLPFGGPFSYSRPNILFATKGLSVIEYDFNSHASTTVFDARSAVPGAGGSAYTPSISDDDNRICLAFGGQQDTHPYVAVLDRRSGAYQVLDTRASTLNGRPASRTLGYGIHSAYMDRSGRYVIIGKGQGRRRGQSEWTIWDVDSGRVYDVESEWSGHDAAGFGVRVNQSGFYGGEPAFYEEQQWAVRGLAENEVNSHKYLLDWRQLPSPHQYIYSGHHSWNNARPDVMVPVVGSIVRDSSKGHMPWRTWDNEIIGVATDGSGTVYRFAHHRSVWDRRNFWDDPRGNISQDGRFFSFTSNWGRTVGPGRHDVFVVELKADREAPPPARAMELPQVEDKPLTQREAKLEPESKPQQEAILEPEPEPGQQPEPKPAPASHEPLVKFFWPVEGQRLPPQGMIHTTATRAGDTARVLNLEVFVNDQLIAAQPHPFYLRPWNPSGPGSYTFRLRATGRGGKVWEHTVTATYGN